MKTLGQLCVTFARQGFPPSECRELAEWSFELMRSGKTEAEAARRARRTLHLRNLAGNQDTEPAKVGRPSLIIKDEHWHGRKR